MILYKFLRKGAIGPYSGFHWPTPISESSGAWVEVEGPLQLASNAIHACRIDQLPYWLDAELWEIELDGPVEEAERHVLGRRGRLLRRVDGWTRAPPTDLLAFVSSGAENTPSEPCVRTAWTNGLQSSKRVTALMG